MRFPRKRGAAAHAFETWHIHDPLLCSRSFSTESLLQITTLIIPFYDNNVKYTGGYPPRVTGQGSAYLYIGRWGIKIMSATMKYLHMVAFVLLVIGGLNWLAIGVLNTNLVMWLFGESMITQIIYILVGVSAVYLAVTHKAHCRACATGSAM